MDEFDRILRGLRTNPAVSLANDDLDTGRRVKFGDYPLADKTYAKLVERLTARGDRAVPEDLRHNILHFYEAARPNLDGTLNARLTTLEQMKLIDGTK